MSWLNQANTVTSKGVTTQKAQSLADLHARREATQSQYYTPAWVAQAIWELLTPSINAAFEAHDCRLPVLDNSVGNGRLIADAPMDKTSLYACDTDPRCIEALMADAEAAGLHYEFTHAGLETLKVKDFAIAILNPPFSLHLESPLLKPYPSTCYGKFGPNTSANSHEYALDQALDAAQIVAAVLPVSMREYCKKSRYFIGEYQLPGDTFVQEGARVSTSVYFFSQYCRQTPTYHKVDADNPWPPLPVLPINEIGRPLFEVAGVDFTKPVIQTPVTGDRRVELHHHNRRLVLKFRCGLVEAKVMNGLLHKPVEGKKGHRHPKAIRFAGDGKFLLDAYLLQPDPDAAFDQFVEEIRQHGGLPSVSSTLAGYWRKLKKRHARAIVPYYHAVKTAGEPTITLRAKRGMLLEQGNTQSPPVRKGQALEAQANGGEYVIEHEGWTATYRRDQAQRLFEFDEDERTGTQWQVVHEGLLPVFPDLAKQYEKQIADAGIDWLWIYQQKSLIEQLMRPYGGIAGWEQGTGKARLALALALLSTGKALITVEPGLLGEMLIEIDKVGLDPDLWRIIEPGAATDESSLRKINLCTYTTLKRTVRGKKTLAKTLRRRFSTVVADEGGILSNLQSQQSQALMALSPRRLFILDGTPIGNYPRDLLPLANASVGGGVAHQPYGIRDNLYMSPNLVDTADMTWRGIDRFREMHVVLEWATNEFRDDLRQGAKREIPKIDNLPLFRKWLAPFVQRRVRNEPEVAPYASCPDPVHQTHSIKWDEEHFRHYLDIAVNFANEYIESLKAAREENKGVNLLVMLAKINGVRQAVSHPHIKSKSGPRTYQPVTSKMRYAVDLIRKYVSDGKKTILYAKSPRALERLNELLKAEGINAVLFHGERSPDERTEEMNREFRFGTCDVLLSSWVGQRGLNFPQVKRVILYDRDWSADTESQAIARTQRPDQEDVVIVDKLHMVGSIDEYVGQVADWKFAASDSALDWGDGATESEVFLHMDAVLENYCEDTLNMSVAQAAQYLNVA